MQEGSHNPLPKSQFTGDRCKCCSTSTPSRTMHKPRHINSHTRIHNLRVHGSVHDCTDNSPKMAAYLAAQSLQSPKSQTLDKSDDVSAEYTTLWVHKDTRTPKCRTACSQYAALGGAVRRCGSEEQQSRCGCLGRGIRLGHQGRPRLLMQAATDGQHTADSFF